MLYHNGDAAKINKFLDTTTERDVKRKYRAWAKDNSPPTIVDKTRIEEALFQDLLGELINDFIDLVHEDGFMKIYFKADPDENYRVVRKEFIKDNQSKDSAARDSVAPASQSLPHKAERAPEEPPSNKAGVVSHPTSILHPLPVLSRRPQKRRLSSCLTIPTLHPTRITLIQQSYAAVRAAKSFLCCSLMATGRLECVSTHASL